jgi:hypothetical protein
LYKLSGIVIRSSFATGFGKVNNSSWFFTAELARIIPGKMARASENCREIKNKEA